MVITMLDGTPDTVNSGLNSFLNELSSALDANGHQTNTIRLNTMKIHRCVGCFGCWVKTPGRCHIRDEMEQVLDAAISCELLVYASPLNMGMTSALLKRICDRMIPLLLPYIRLVDGAQRHAKRYESYPRLALLMEPEPDTDEEDLGIIRNIYTQMAADFRSELVFTGTTELKGKGGGRCAWQSLTALPAPKAATPAG